MTKSTTKNKVKVFFMLWLRISSCYGVIYEFRLIHDVYFKVKAEIRNKWKKIPMEEKASFKKQARKHFVMYQQQLEKSFPNQEKYEVQIICVYV